jgi:hypothetical protein
LGDRLLALRDISLKLIPASFKGVQQPVCIVLASRSANAKTDSNTAAKVLFQALPGGHRLEKFKALAAHEDKEARHGSRARPIGAPHSCPLRSGLGQRTQSWKTSFIYNGSGVMPGRTWIIAPDVDSLERRWEKLVHAPADQKEDLFHPHLSERYNSGDRHSRAASYGRALAGIRSGGEQGSGR